MVCYKRLCRPDCQCSTTASNGDSTTCIALERAYRTLQSVFQHSIFRPGQLESVLPALHGRDVFVRMANGAGKSLAMFLVPLAYSDMAVGAIISPLVSLMDEQVKHYQKN